VAADGGVVAEDFILGDRFARADGVVEVGLVIDGVAVSGRVGIGLALRVDTRGQSCRFGMVFVPFLQILVSQHGRPAVNRIAFRLGTRVLRLVGEGRVFDDHGALGAVEADELAALVVQVAAQSDAAVGIVVESFDEVGELAAILEVEQASGGLGAQGGLFDAGDELDAGEQVDEEIAAEALAVVFVATPAEEANGIERDFGRVAEEGVPVDGFFAGVGRHGINPGAAGRIAVPVGVDGEDFAEFAGIVNFFGLGVEDGTDALAADGDHALIFLRGFDHGESVFDSVRHGLLAVDVFAGGAGVFKNAAMVVVHGGDEDRVDVLAIENGAIVAGGGDTGVADGFLGGGVAAVIQVTNRDALDAGNAERGFEVFASTNAGADGSEANGVAGRDGTRRGGKHMRLQDGFGDRGGGDSARAEVNELTTGQGILGHRILRLDFVFRDCVRGGTEWLRGGIITHAKAEK
jgi:hypothetical protein